MRRLVSATTPFLGRSHSIHISLWQNIASAPSDSTNSDHPSVSPHLLGSHWDGMDESAAVKHASVSRRVYRFMCKLWEVSVHNGTLHVVASKRGVIPRSVLSSKSWCALKCGCYRQEKLGDNFLGAFDTFGIKIPKFSCPYSIIGGIFHKHFFFAFRTGSSLSLMQLHWTLARFVIVPQSGRTSEHFFPTLFSSQ